MRRLWTVRLFYFMAGIGVSAWAVAVPYTKIRFGLDDGTLGLILLASGTGGVLAMPFTGPLIRRFGSRRVLLWSGAGFGIAMPMLSIAPSPVTFTIILFAFGALFGGLDVAVNAQAAVLEAQTGRRQMSVFHSMYSIGGLAAALATSFLLKNGLGNPACGALAGAAIFLILTQGRHLAPPHEDRPMDAKALALPNRATIILGICCLACFLTEGAVTDWSTIFLRFSRHLPLDEAALGYAAFSVMMAASRLLGDRVAMRFGAARVMFFGCVVAVAGFALAIAAPGGLVGMAGFGLVGLGAGNIAPLVFSAAARVPGMAANHSVPAVVGLGYVGFLLGPVAIGFVAHASSLSVAFCLNAALLCAISIFARAVG